MKKPENMNASLKVVICAVAGVAAIAVAVLATNLYRDRKAAGFRSSIELYIRDTTSTRAVEDSLKAHARWPRRVHRILKKEAAGAPFKPGHYTIEPSSTVTFAARMLIHGWQTPVNLTLSGSLRRKGDIAKKISMQMMADSSSVAAALDDEELLAGLGVTPATAFALFIPDTYQFYWTETPEAILGRMKEAADAFWTKDNLRKASDLNLTRMEITTLASIVTGETRIAEDMPKIAGVYLNRLKRGMKLQACPTVAFCFDYNLTRILNKHLQVKSPYNTYIHTGLPPGPICSPSKEALTAVLNPDLGGGALFFCADPAFNGRHRFARTFAEHSRNAREYQKALARRKK